MPTQHIYLTIECPYTLRLPDGEYPCRLGTNKFRVIIERIPARQEESTRQSSVVVTPATGEVKFEGEAAQRRTRASITFVLVVPENIDKGPETKIWELCRRFFNAFINSYRYLFHDSRVYPLAPAEFYSVRHGIAPRFKAATVDDAGHGARQMGVTHGDWPLEIRSEPTLSDSEVQRFRELLRQNAQPPIVDLLLLNAQTYIDRGEYRLAVIEAGAALDIAVEDAGFRLLVAQGTGKAEAASQLEQMNTVVIAKSIVQPRLSWDLLGSEEWQEYNSQLRPLRNAVVHDALEPDKNQSQNFLATMTRIVERLC